MRTLYSFTVAGMLTLLAAGCTCSPRCTTHLAANFINKQTLVTTTKQNYAPKNPDHIALYSDNNRPLKAYRVIGVATISKYNLMGGIRQSQTLDGMMKNLAASIGGDALIKVSSNNEIVRAQIIQFQKILL